MAAFQPNERALRRIKVAAFILCLAPTAWLMWRGMSDDLGANPIEAAIRFCGRWALILLLVSLAVTPLRLAAGLNWLVRLRRMLGLFAFYYACLHLLLFVGVDQFFDWATIGREIVKRPFISVGMASFVLLLPLAATSSDAMIRRLGGRRWQRLHRAVYVAACGGVLHYYWLVKKDVSQPLLYGGILTVLLLSRPLLSGLRRRSSG